MDVNTVASDRIPDIETVLWWSIVINVEILLLGGYLLLAPVTPTDILTYIYPFVWINIAIWALGRTAVPSVSRSKRYGGGLIALGYLFVLGLFGGLYGPGMGEMATGLRIEFVSLPPGWGPAVLYSGELVRVALLPFKVVGYLTLAYLVYVTILDAAGNPTAGIFGLFSCVSCVLPLIAATVSGIIGGGGALVAVASRQSYALSTVVFVLTVLLLVWRPTAGSFSQLRTKLRT
ncbi:DUF7546 family protein [Halocatena pleomorpha]|uniref:Uncharacterized protein n=1 Tax=Halocatena pleomorpha TaxID=1785090 RepID=A0A3P3RH00_9EURY|nr:hypothetical protein [Halocatena pleomorpha]RRJ32030.1 hypothetical protein EIK79_05750 [Halocatena pleomorpha]